MFREYFVLTISEERITFASATFGESNSSLQGNVYDDGRRFNYDGWNVHIHTGIRRLIVRHHNVDIAEEDYAKHYELASGILTLGSSEREMFMPLAEFRPTGVAVRLRSSDFGLTEVRRVNMLPREHAVRWVGPFTDYVKRHAGPPEMCVVLSNVPGYYLDCVDQGGNMRDMSPATVINLLHYGGALTFTYPENIEMGNWVVICRRAGMGVEDGLIQSAALMTTIKDVWQLASSLRTCLNELGVSSFLDVCPKIGISRFLDTGPQFCI